MTLADSTACPPSLHAALLRDSDLEQVLAVENRAYSHPWGHGHFVDSLNSQHHLLGLWQDTALRGYYVAMEGVQEVHLLNITVAPDHQRQGLARWLLDDLARWARTRCAESLWLEVRASNARAIAVYEAWGFERVGLRKGYYPLDRTQREDAVVMGCTL